MSNKQIYRQVKMKRMDEEGRGWIDVSWIPAKHAKVGKNLILTDMPEGAQDGWIVLEVWGSREDNEVKLQTDAQREFVKKLDKKNRRDK